MRKISDWAGHSRKALGPSGDSPESLEGTLRYSLLAGIGRMLETFPPVRAKEAHDRASSGRAGFRVVPTMPRS